MKTWKLVSGVLSIILFVVISFQSCAVSIVNVLEQNGSSSGIAGIIVGMLMLAGGIVSITSRKSSEKSGNVTLVILFGLAALEGFVGYGNYTDLLIWSIWCLINAVLAGVTLLTIKGNGD